MIELKSKTEKGDDLVAKFDPENGMTLVSYQLGNLEVIDQERAGKLICPHYQDKNQQNTTDEFRHGVARYASWNAEVTGSSVHAELKGDTLLDGKELKLLAGQNFKVLLDADLSSMGLKIELSVVSETDSLIGLDLNYRLPEGTGKVLTRVKDVHLQNSEYQKIPSEWGYDPSHRLSLSLDQEVSSTFFPFPDFLKGEIVLDAGKYQVKTVYQSNSQENSWSLVYPSGASYVSIQPISSQDPLKPNLTVSSLKVLIQIL